MGPETTSTKSLLGLIIDADVTVQLVMLILFTSSIWSWTIIIYKWLSFDEIFKKTSHFEKIFGQVSIDKLFDHIENSAKAPIEKLFIATVKKKKKGADKSELNSVIITTKNRCIEELEDKMSYLATVASATPFIGLFGTVWGIMHSFQSIAESKNTSLAIVAPGIAEALLATGLGLIAAIPALIFYNILNAKIYRIENNLDNFAIELYTKLTNRD
jgi:biopolymer transport protein TolQ